MMTLVLAAWMACGTDFSGEKLSETWIACYQTGQKPATPEEKFWADEYKPKNVGPYGSGRIGSCTFVSPAIQWAVPNTLMGGSPSPTMYPWYP
jgi:hypothetical protein